MKTTLLAGFAAALLAGVLPIRAIATDSPALKYGLCINFGLPTFAKPGEQGELPASRFAPASVNVKSWAHTAKEAGMTFAVPIVKHANGFCLWPAADYDYDIAHSPFKENKPDATSRLKGIKEFFDKGLINQETYDRKRKEILDVL